MPSIYGVSTALLLVSACIPCTRAAYNLTMDYSGANFFNNFDFFTGNDPTSGTVQYLNETAANATSLAGYMNTGSGTNGTLAVYMAVDSTNEAPNGRGSVRVTSTQAYHHGLVIADIAHMPTGCGTWPAFWMVGMPWPSNGEIDIVEGVNLQAQNAMTLHTGPGVTLSSTPDFSGELQSTDCEGNAGCQILDNSNVTFGTDFNSNGGGVYATEWTSEFIKIWFFARGSIPSDIGSPPANPSDSWGTPASFFQGDFNMDEEFTNLQIVFNTDFCGDWAGTVWNTSQCASLAPTCEQYVQSTPSAFADTYWAINSLQVWQDSATNNSLVALNPPLPGQRRRR